MAVKKVVKKIKEVLGLEKVDLKPMTKKERMAAHKGFAK